ncbi:MAG TPA: DUF1549 domain-containing protein [Candidatus Acidoferrales bacterium]|nr:DUF1549 domain-containing protein [Candidatus Acidoferrales bacterium]
MKKPGRLSVPQGVLILAFTGLLVFTGMLIGQTSDTPAPPDTGQLTVSHPECSFFGPLRERFAREALQARGSRDPRAFALSGTTEKVSAMLGNVPGGSRTYSYDQSHQAGSIDSYIFADFQANSITPAPASTDWEFIRRVTLDLTGRIPTADRVLTFVADTGADKRAKLVDELLAKPEWVDKWTMFYGDLYQNTVARASNSLNRFAQGRNAFYQYIRDSLASGKPYNQMATDLITATDADSYTNGPTNYLLNGFITGGPMQDAIDAMTAATFDTFMGMSHVNCLLCHNGRGHLDTLSLWAGNTTRYQAWELASYLSRTQLARVTADTVNPNPNIYYWSVLDNVKGYTNDYTLNTATGNRPARTAPSGCKAGQPCQYVAPQYIFNGDTPKPGENYRVALARDITGDFQFARASVNYIWAQFFGRGIVDPPDSFDPARLNPDSPPPAPWTLQPSNARLLNALAQHFIDSGYNVKSLMREIAVSDTYQLSSRYDGTWNAAWEPYFARKFVRRLWAEEVHDAVAQSSGTFPSYSITGFTDQGYAKPSYAMQLPDTVNMPAGDIGTNFLDSFLRGNRDDQPRRQDGSILQALNLMNNTFVEGHVAYTGATASQLVVAAIAKGNADGINSLYLNILSRYPTSTEMSTAMAAVPAASGTTRSQAIQDLAWSLYNKVDFVFNY